MRRTDREVKESAFFKDVFDKSLILTVAFNDGEYPYCVPLNFAEFEGALYFHCAREGHKLECLARDPHVHFNAFDSLEVESCKATIFYRSVSGTGVAEIVEDEQLKKDVFAAIMNKYCGTPEIPPFKKPEKTHIVKISITSLTGKQHAKPAV